MRRPLATLALATLCSLASAQSWYEVEIIVFSQSHPDLYSPGATEESWPESLNPDWPTPLIRLNSDASPSPAMRPLPTGQRRLNNDAYALRVTTGYEVLWHQAWLQPMLDQQHAPWIRIESGEPLGEHFPLEGGLRIYLERFLHLETDLWLNNFHQTEPDGESPALAFSLPPRNPVPPACVFLTHQWPEGLQMEQPELEPGSVLNDWWYPPFDCGLQNIAPPAGLPLASVMDPYIRVESPSIRFTLATGDPATPGDLREVRPLVIGNFQREETGRTAGEAVWQVNQIIPMRQSRRMRSNELHYLDHPRLGVLALITPVDPPVLSAEEWLQQQPQAPVNSP